ncbi:MAG: hypothetical protein CO186_08125 [Zetaproteobacteria bacterium CG_4_9_14_3_um_filter_49_83]|nr:MAG: hypothetical protein AUJ56_08335 [Zetaproteobacteria bacterium CG1_02_49_23]PIQ34068.1 MAG: hypothetical protein COW62_03215 [Zetaproteobacteria bacterium CG17_big_fil_post_rev_8_21_14_2_50_50_13]PIV31494.1 MAG: hypothetical protein COS35_01125 [Zetaproteobacteria bacterium CG02_land_8_20_14_3_00_50_9]PIY55884.1 MAG: hypothetical protein COZ00_07125 [Zetaproteobacteria bacterium CG_4_10_14_0_8_um_filter_49_80]PJA35014.1 MAG: hypothetical protein CO186_08125 [Zetaproteobacteria bacterium
MVELGMFLLVINVAWGCVFMLPATLAGKRRSDGKPAYWHLLLVSWSLEVLSIIGTIKLFEILPLGTMAEPIITPLLASVIGGFSYWWLSARCDANKSREMIS